MIKDIRMVRNWANKNFKGFAYVEYKDQSGLKKAINKYHNQIF
jgi:RNA recognition motif-containing protein